SKSESQKRKQIPRRMAARDDNPFGLSRPRMTARREGVKAKARGEKREGEGENQKANPPPFAPKVRGRSVAPARAKAKRRRACNRQAAALLKAGDSAGIRERPSQAPFLRGGKQDSGMASVRVASDQWDSWSGESHSFA